MDREHCFVCARATDVILKRTVAGRADWCVWRCCSVCGGRYRKEQGPVAHNKVPGRVEDLPLYERPKEPMTRAQRLAYG